MTKVFAYMLENIKECSILLIVGIAVVYTAIRIFKGILSLFLKGKKSKEQVKQRELQAELVVDKLGGVEAFSECVAEKVINKQKVYIGKLKQEIEEIQAMDRCPIELKAYIETVLKTSPQLRLQYEELKVKYKGKSVPQDITKAKGIQEYTQDKREEQTTVQADIKEEQKEDISYV